MLADLLDISRVKTDLRSADKESALRSVAALLVKPEERLNEETVYEVLAERERLASTGVGSGVAIPHGRYQGVDDLRAAVAVHKDGVSFDAVDGRPVRILVGILGPLSSPQKHLAVLAQVSRVLRQEAVRQALIAASDRDEAYRLLTDT